MSRRHAEHGQVTAFVVVFTTAMLFVAGLVVDGGYLLTAKREAINVAEHAARAGAQALSIDQLRASGQHVLDAQHAAAAAHAYLASAGHQGNVAVAGDQITVTVDVRRAPVILGIAGVGEFTVTGHATARNVRGVTGADT